MKAGLLLCLLSTLLIPGLAGDNTISLKRLQTAHSTEVQARACGKVSDELCDVCLRFYVENINTLLNIILDGIIGGCGDLCGELAKETNKLTGEICEIFCVLAGFEAFVKFMDKADFDPIYFCELLDVCAINDNGDAKIIDPSVSPKSGPQGEFMFTMTVNTVNGTGTGELAILIDTVDGIPIGDAEIYCYKPGSYNVGWNLKAEPNHNCEEPPCEMWLPGTYNVTLAVCYGKCYSDHPHSAIYDEAHLTFKITG